VTTQGPTPKGAQLLKQIFFRGEVNGLVKMYKKVRRFEKKNYKVMTKKLKSDELFWADKRPP